MDAQRGVVLLTSTAAVSKTYADNKKAQYFEAYEHALELGIAREATGTDLPTSLANENGALSTLDYGYRTAGASATWAAKKQLMTRTRHTCCDGRKD